ncbi:hypothetical protein [Bailinhaonella thermotolerans]|uniref:hypothetical protein n=1 Tax=Bailinhaonella thermotolerans TaxID=1070861 RepID=UPI00192A531F|nr:hypothetical protein [Bailinhaonella thermotolerans]
MPGRPDEHDPPTSEEPAPRPGPARPPAAPPLPRPAPDPVAPPGRPAGERPAAPLQEEHSTASAPAGGESSAATGSAGEKPDGSSGGHGASRSDGGEEVPDTPRSAPWWLPLRWPGAWRVYVYSRIKEVRGEAGRLHAAHGDAVAGVESVCRAIEGHLRSARVYVDERHGFRRWISGEAVEGAWQNVHQAQVLLLSLLPEEELPAKAAEVLVIGRAYLPPDDPRLTELSGRVSARDVGEADRPLLIAVLKAAYLGNTLETGRVRTFRNVLLGTAVALTLIIGGLVAVSAAWPAAVPLCVAADTPANAERAVSAAGAQPARICPTGKDRPTGGDVPLIALVGLIGAALAAARAISTGKELPTRHTLTVAQYVIKAPTGVATAILGLLTLSSGFVPGFAGLKSQPAMLFWALVFGYAQQLLTGLVDQRARALLEAASPVQPQHSERKT